MYRKRPPAHPASAPAVPARGTHAGGNAMIVNARTVDVGTRSSGPFGPPIDLASVLDLGILLGARFREPLVFEPMVRTRARPALAYLE